YITALVQNDRFNVGGEEGEYPFNAYSIRDLANSKAGCSTLALLLDHISFERLDTFLVSFYNLVVHGDIVTCPELRELFFTGQLLVYVCNGVHKPVFKE